MGAARRVPSALRAAADPFLSRRHLLPDRLDRALEAARWMGPAPGDLPEPPVPISARGDGALLVAPANFAGQGWQWARAYERVSGRSAASWMITADPVFAYPSDHTVALASAHRAPRTWQRRRFAQVVTSFDAVVLEAGRPLFGSLFGFDPRREAEALAGAGLRVAVLWHGTDVRLPSRHIAHHPLSPYATPELRARSRRLESVALRNRRRMRGLAGPTFVSTPDLLREVPGARWCPVVVDVDGWAGGAPVLERARPVVVHVPSNPAIKGSDLVRPALRRLHDSGVVDYREAAGLPWDQVRELYRSADLVLDQFRLGIYGVAACEAMAAGRVVLSVVDASVREDVLVATGRELPVLETPADRVAERVAEVLADRAGARRRGADGVAFVRAVHDGRRSGEALTAFVDGAAELPRPENR